MSEVEKARKAVWEWMSFISDPEYQADIDALIAAVRAEERAKMLALAEKMVSKSQDPNPNYPGDSRLCARVIEWANELKQLAKEQP